MVGDTNRGARGHVAAQVIAAFGDRDEPAELLAGDKRRWASCPAGQPFTVTGDADVTNWVGGDIIVDEIGTTTVRQGAEPRTCHHVLASRANLVVEAFACGDGDTTAQANQIVDRILVQFPE